ncbi:hypothetical protein lbkm_0328 [Lachnospiraceae bacterium KM106-2]|nr:hypothetical protein lbkm_0328 [Lachnospiraceae bacterium KM106-2]
MDYRDHNFNRNNRNNLGDQIHNTVQDALDSMNFERLNRDISDSVSRAINEAKRCLNGNDPYQNSGENPYRENGHRNDDRQYQAENGADRNPWNRSFRYGGFRYPPRNNKVRQVAPYTLSSPPGRVSSVLCLVFGYVGAASFGIATFVLALLAGLSIASSVLGTIAGALLPFFVLSVGLIFRGNTLSKRVKRYRQYCSVLGKNTFCDLKEFEQQVGKSHKFVVKDIRMMIHKGMFPQGHLDDKASCFMLNHETYEQYLQTKERFEEHVKEKQEQEENEKKKEEMSELERTIEEGRRYITEIKLANDKIPGEEISRKLARLEEVIRKIFDCVKEHPEQLPELRKFMDYYLPTTLKLVKAYEDFDSQPIQGENIKKGKEEIGKTLDTINTAFETLLDSLYESTTMEVSSDISVLKTLLAGDGLTKKDFKVK